MDLNKVSQEVSLMQTWKTLDRRRVEANRPAFRKGEVQMTTCVFLNVVAVLPQIPLS